MIDTLAAPSSTAEREITATRLIDAPREVVFRMWTDPDHVQHWWGPNGFTITIHEFDARPGGVWRFVMHGPDGRDYPNYIVFDELDVPERIVFTHGREGEPGQFRATVTFGDEGGKTRLTMRSTFRTVEERNMVAEKYGAVEGMEQTIARLRAHVGWTEAGLSLSAPTTREIVVERVVDAPRQRVWRAFTDAKQIARWWGRGNKVVVERMEVERGGHWRFVEHGPDGAHGFEGRYREVTPQERIVNTFEWDGMPGYVAVNTVTFEDLGDGRTRVVTISLFHTAAERDGMLSSGMAGGMGQSYKALDRLLAEGGAR